MSCSSSSFSLLREWSHCFYSEAVRPQSAGGRSQPPRHRARESLHLVEKSGVVPRAGRVHQKRDGHLTFAHSDDARWDRVRIIADASDGSLAALFVIESRLGPGTDEDGERSSVLSLNAADPDVVLLRAGRRGGFSIYRRLGLAFVIRITGRRASGRAGRQELILLPHWEEGRDVWVFCACRPPPSIPPRRGAQGGGNSESMRLRFPAALRAPVTARRAARCR